MILPRLFDAVIRLLLLLSMVTSAAAEAIEAIAHVRDIWRGTHRSENLIDFLVEAIRVECTPPTPLQIAGDPLGDRSFVRARLHDRPIRVVDYYAPPPV